MITVSPAFVDLIERAIIHGDRIEGITREDRIHAILAFMSGALMISDDDNANASGQLIFDGILKISEKREILTADEIARDGALDEIELDDAILEQIGDKAATEPYRLNGKHLYKWNGESYIHCAKVPRGIRNMDQALEWLDQQDR